MYKGPWTKAKGVKTEGEKWGKWGKGEWCGENGDNCT